MSTCKTCGNDDELTPSEAIAEAHLVVRDALEAVWATVPETSYSSRLFELYQRLSSKREAASFLATRGAADTRPNRVPGGVKEKRPIPDHRAALRIARTEADRCAGLQDFHGLAVAERIYDAIVALDGGER